MRPVWHTISLSGIRLAAVTRQPDYNKLPLCAYMTAVLTALE